MREVGQAVRGLMSSPSAALISVFALALGIGVNVTMLISLNAMLLHPFPYPDSNRLVMVSGHANRSDAKDPLSPGDFTDIQNSRGIFSSIAAFRAADFIVRTSGTPDHITGAVVTPSFFRVFGLAPDAGSSSLDDRRGAVVSYSFWKSHLGSSPAAIGSTIRVGGTNRIVTGIMPDSFDFPLGTQVWVPLEWSPHEQQERASHDLSVIGRLQQGVSARQAKTFLEGLAQRAAAQFPEFNRNRSLSATPLRQWLVDDVTSHFLVILFGAALFVLLLACVNVGNLQLARATRMRKQIAVQIALGAARLQTLRPFLIQNLVLALAASGAALLLAGWSNSYLRSRLPAQALQHVPGLRTMHIDGTVLAITFTLTILAALLCVLPAAWFLFQAANASDINDWLRERTTDSAAASSRKSWLRSGLMVAQLSLAMVLLLAAGLMVQTFQHLLNRNQGFDPHNLLTAQLSLAGERSSAAAIPFYDDFLRELSSNPGIVAAGIASRFGAPEYFQIEGRPSASAAEVHPDLSGVNSQYLKAMRIPLLAGRNISAGDRLEKRHVAVISQSLAQRYWSHRSSSIGERVRFSAAAGGGEWFTIVGVCGDVVEDWFSGVPQASLYVPYTQSPALWADVAIRTTGDPALLAPDLRAVTQRLDPDAAVYDIKSMQARNFEERFGVYSAAESMTQYAVIALLLALTGVYAVISFFVAARTRDIGVRIALGASSRAVLAMTMRQTVQVLAIALAIGVPLSVLLARGMSHVLYGVVTVNEGTIAGVAVLLSMAALLASLLPAWRATRIDPMLALREQ